MDNKCARNKITLQPTSNALPSFTRSIVKAAARARAVSYHKIWFAHLFRQKSTFSAKNRPFHQFFVFAAPYASSKQSLTLYLVERSHVGLLETSLIRQHHPWPRSPSKNPSSLLTAFRGFFDIQVVSHLGRSLVILYPVHCLPYIWHCHYLRTCRTLVYGNGTLYFGGDSNGFWLIDSLLIVGIVDCYFGVSLKLIGDTQSTNPVRTRTPASI